MAWSLEPGERFPVATLDDPAVNLTRERGGIERSGRSGAGEWLTGPVSAGRFDVTLRGAGSVLGVKFTIGGLLAFADAPLAALRDRTVPAGRWLPAMPGLEAGIDADDAAPAFDRWLLGLEPSAPPGAADFHGLLALLEQDPCVTSVEALAAASGCSVRAVQRLFRRFAGVGPKRMLIRARVRDAVAALDGLRAARSEAGGAASTAASDAPALAELAARLGWFDQAHFTRDFRRVAGVTPAQYAAAR